MIQLIPPTKEMTRDLKNMLLEFKHDRYAGFLSEASESESTSMYFQMVKIYEEGRKIGPSRVPASTYWLVNNDTIVGHINIRHRLNDFLKTYGGHIGYAIRPSKRNKGYGTIMLQMALPHANKLSINPALVTCDEDNIASRKIIEKSGGQLYKTKIYNGKNILLFWVNTSS